MKLSQQQMIALELEKLRPAIEAYGFDLREDHGITVLTANDGVMWAQLFKAADGKYFGYGIHFDFPPETTATHIAEDVEILVKAACLDFKNKIGEPCPKI